MADNWVVPTSFSDPDSVWTDETKAYDGDIATYAYVETSDGYLELILDAIKCDKIRIYVGSNYDPPQDPTVYIDVYYGAAWHNIHSGQITNDEWVEKEIGSDQEVTKARIKIAVGMGIMGHLKEFNFNSLLSTVTTQSPTAILSTTVTANGNITQKGVSNITVRGFKYGLTQVDTWSASDSGNFTAGAYTKGLTGLSVNTTYWIRAYVTDTEGTYYGAWVEFQTAASGTIPTGTKIEVGSDYSGYTYGLQESETDDGSAYTAYFVISTDLTDKRGLAFYKRILDLHLYFNSESSGTADIYVKRDHEASWQSVGSVTLIDTADIIVEHLACRIYGKHFLFKMSAANHFEFLGCLFEFLRKGLR